MQYSSSQGWQEATTAAEAELRTKMTQRRISIQTPLDHDRLLIRSATVTEQLGQPFEIHVDLLSPEEDIDFDELLGKDMHVAIDLDDGGKRFFHGHIAEFRQIGRVGRHASYHARVVPWLWFLTCTADCRIFQNKTVPEIVKEVFGDHGYTDVKDALTKSYRKRDYCVQYRESTFNFVQRLLEEEGIYYYFEHTERNHMLVLVDSYSGHKATEGYESIDYFPPSENAQRPRDHIHDWQWARKIQPGKYVSTDFDFTKPRAMLQTQFVQNRKVPKSDYEVFDYPGKYTATSDGDHYSQTRLQSLQTGYETIKAAANTRGLGVGALFALTGYPRRDQNREYLVVYAVHQLDAGEYEARTGAQAKTYSSKFEAIDSGEPYAPQRRATKVRVSGPQTATVVGPDGEEIYTDKYGRVKVKFHWDRDPNRNESSSCWVRVSQIWAGKNWGWMSIPRIGQEVVVDFLEGDPDQPLITGRVYNQDNMPPYGLPDNKTQSGFKSRSSMQGTAENFNEIRFEDKKGAEQLYIHAEKNQDIMVENDETHTVGHDQRVHIQHDRTERVDRNETVSIGGFHTETVTLAKAENIGLAKALTIGAAYQVSVGAGMNTTVALAKTEEVGLSKNVLVGKNIYIQAGDELEIVVGKSNLVMKSDGTVLINGSQFNFAASGPVQISGKDIDLN